MKNFFRSMMLVAVAAMGFAACSTENTTDPAVEFEPNMVEMSIIAEQTRTTLDSSEAFANWEADDQIAVFEVADAISITGSTETILNDGLASFRFSFEKNTNASSFDYYAVYPYANVVSDNYKTMEQIKLITPATQNPSATSFDGAADLLLSRPVTDLTAQPSEAMSMAFTRVVALAKMTLKNLDTAEPIINVTFTAPEGKVLAGRSYFNLTTGEAVEYGYSNQGTNTITLNYTGLESVAAGTPIYFTTLPTELVAGDTFTVTVSTENKKFTKEVTIPEGRNIAFIAGDMASFGVNMSGAAEETVENFTGEYVVAAVSKGLQLMGNISSNTNYLTNTTIDSNATAIPDSYTYTDESLVWIVENGANAGEYYIKQKSTGKYIYAVSGLNNAKLGNTPEALTIVKENDGSYTITSSADTGNRVLRYNASSPRFAFYASGQTVIYLIPAVASVNPSIKVDEQPAQVAAAGAKVTVNLTTANLTEAITATTEAEWITDATVADNVLTFTVAANDTTEERTATITLSANGASDTVNVSQAGKVEEGEAFVKITSTNDLADGQYLIVYETSKWAFNGSLVTLDAISNYKEVTISNNTIEANDETKAISFTIKKSSGYYSIKSASSQYIGVSSNSNGLKTTTNATTYKHSISFDSGNAKIKAEFTNSTMYLKFNKTSGQTRFRYFKNDGQEAIALYKLTTTGGGDEPTTEQLATPTVTTSVADNVVTVSWNEVANATSYDVTCGTESKIGVTGTSTTFTMGWNATYDVKVVAKSSDANYTASAAGTATAVVGADPNAGGDEGGEPTTETFTFSNMGYNDATTVATVDGTNITLTFAKNNGSNDPMYYDSGSAIRMYKSNTLTIAGDVTITNVKITFVSKSYMGSNFDTTNGGSYSATDGVGTWTGSQSSIIFQNTTSGSESTQARIKSIEVTYQ